MQGRRRPFFDLTRDPPADHRVPFEIDVLHRDDTLLVVDKPHFLSTTPRGRHVTESVVIRLRTELELPELSPAHRLDRVTAGVLVLTVNRVDRGAYQTLFAGRRVDKTYEAVAAVDADLEFPRVVRSRIVKLPGSPLAVQQEGPVNAETRIELLGHAEGTGLYRLHPSTGRTHQLRLHMLSLGLPIRGDNFYPELLDTAMDDYRNPLQLLARSLAFTDPFTGELRTFVSTRTLDHAPLTPR